MNYDINEMRRKLLDAFDSNSNYTLENFNKEFDGNMSMSNNDNFKIPLSFKNESTNPDPEYATAGSSGFDLRANLNEDIILSSQGGFAIIPTGLFFEIPENFEIQIRPRSGLAAKNQVSVINTPGTIDSDYRGEIKIILINHGLNDFTISHGDRIAQGVMAAVTAKNYINLIKVNNISEDTERGIGGFGSTGTK
jgi:dUTP pyrophosphatase